MIAVAPSTSGTPTATDATPNTAPGVDLGTGRRTPRLLELGQLLGEWEADARAAFEARTKAVPRGPVSGIASLDEALGGVLHPGLHIVHGGPGVGKTAWALQVAGTCGVPALYVSAEMRPLELLRRITARVTGTYLGRLKSGELTPEDSLAKARQAIAALPRFALVDATDAWASPEWLRQAALAVRGDARHVLVAVDSVHSWSEASDVGLDEYDRLNAAIGALRTLADHLGGPVLGIAERNRASMVGGGLSAAAGSRKFEYGAESVLDLSVDEKGAPAPGVGEAAVALHVAKNRNGAAGKRLRLAFNGALQRFTDLERA